MWKYTFERIVLVFITIFIILSLTYILMKLLPVSKPVGLVPAQIAFYDKQVALGYMVKYTDFIPTDQLTADTIKVVSTNPAHTYYYNYLPIMSQYFSWITNIFTKWDWGTSTAIKPNASVMSIIGERLPYSVKINIWATLIDIPIGFGLGIWAAVKKNKPTDTVISTLIMIFISIPSFVLVSFMILVFAYGTGNVSLATWPADSAPLSSRVMGYFIPVATLAAGSIAGFTRYTRAELTEVMSNDFMLLARTKGLTKSQAIVRHALRNSGVVLFPMVIGEFISVLGGSMILEQLYAIPGIGSLFVTALGRKDYNVVMVDMAMYTAIGLFANLFVDLSYGWIDPRIRMGAKK